jgi:hypothetical protein
MPLQYQSRLEIKNKRNYNGIKPAAPYYLNQIQYKHSLFQFSEMYCEMTDWPITFITKINQSNVDNEMVCEWRVARNVGGSGSNLF